MAKKPVQSKVLKAALAASSAGTRRPAKKKSKAEAKKADDRLRIKLAYQDAVERLAGPEQDVEAGPDWKLRKRLITSQDQPERLAGPERERTLGPDPKLRIRLSTVENPVERLAGPEQEKRRGVSWRLKKSKWKAKSIKGRVYGPSERTEPAGPEVPARVIEMLRSRRPILDRVERTYGPELPNPPTLGPTDPRSAALLGPEDPRLVAGPTPPSRSVMLGRKYGPRALAALAGLGGLAGIANYAYGEAERVTAEDAFREFRRNQRQQVINQMADQAGRQSLQAAIDSNLRRVAQSDPAMYAQVMAGRRLPQGAVVLGGEQRTDLLQELGRAMAEGQFTQ